MAKKFWVSVPVWASAGIEIKAESAEEAIEKAMLELSPCLCHHCASEVDLSDLNWDEAEAEPID